MTAPGVRPPSRPAGVWTAAVVLLMGLLMAGGTCFAVVLWELTHRFCLDGPSCPGPGALDLTVYATALCLPALYFAGTAPLLLRRGFTGAAGVQAVFLTGWLVSASVLALRLLPS
ncbi:hypothetical protein ABZZ36_14690 [Actinacidiphila glaucinigra]|uniref:hypothetical protein n=1 Tax=Actinacidiphila glaucinigra TaxID=235986 RepID=UPI0033A55A2E